VNKQLLQEQLDVVCAKQAALAEHEQLAQKLQQDLDAALAAARASDPESLRKVTDLRLAIELLPRDEKALLDEAAKALRSLSVANHSIAQDASRMATEIYNRFADVLKKRIGSLMQEKFPFKDAVSWLFPNSRYAVVVHRAQHTAQSMGMSSPVSTANNLISILQSIEELNTSLVEEESISLASLPQNETR
jgi:hypothetical protein